MGKSNLQQDVYWWETRQQRHQGGQGRTRRGKMTKRGIKRACGCQQAASQYACPPQLPPSSYEGLSLTSFCAHVFCCVCARCDCLQTAPSPCSSVGMAAHFVCTHKSLASLPAAPRDWEHQPCLTALRLRRNLQLLELHRVSSTVSERGKHLCPQTHRTWLLLNRSFPWNSLLFSGNIHTSILT